MNEVKEIRGIIQSELTRAKREEVADFYSGFCHHFLFRQDEGTVRHLAKDFYDVLSPYPAQVIDRTYSWMIRSCRQRPSLAVIKDRLDHFNAPLLNTLQLLSELEALPLHDGNQ